MINIFYNKWLKGIEQHLQLGGWQRVNEDVVVGALRRFVPLRKVDSLGALLSLARPRLLPSEPRPPLHLTGTARPFYTSAASSDSRFGGLAALCPFWRRRLLGEDIYLRHR